MAQFPYPLVFDGKAYNAQVAEETDAVLKDLFAYLPSFYLSSIPSTNYGIELKAFATEVAKIKVLLDSISADTAFRSTRSEFLYSIVGHLIFLNGNLPKVSWSDAELRNFLIAIITIYFQGSTPASISQGIELFTNYGVSIVENYQSTESSYDISDQFTFDIVFEISGNSLPQDFISLDNNIKLIVGIIKPAHTLFRLKYIFSDNVDVINTITDNYMHWDMNEYRYDDVRKNWRGQPGHSRLGVNTPVAVSEDVTYQLNKV
jgi:hypothetical protein